MPWHCRELTCHSGPPIVKDASEDDIIGLCALASPSSAAAAAGAAAAAAAGGGSSPPAC
eukprot:CAMPEP_0115422732 /NCGR_PEP_ID=MMETSP0271-20121206/26931_1 /TAXON_ID=71861 /ORGANISM="Scrippsiella trochoidea, Strain CCMP3099" /LENGTH=58 /DNA_ID=CAMNT_0002847439 /DNA_START=172 /DNA_END=346 /DNA_ORIENTATION=+